MYNVCFLCVPLFDQFGQRLSEQFLIKNLAYPPYYLLVGLVMKGVKVAPVLVAFQSRLSQLQAAAAWDFKQQDI